MMIPIANAFPLLTLCPAPPPRWVQWPVGEDMKGTHNSAWVHHYLTESSHFPKAMDLNDRRGIQLHSPASQVTTRDSIPKRLALCVARLMEGVGSGGRGYRALNSYQREAELGSNLLKKQGALGHPNGPQF